MTRLTIVAAVLAATAAATPAAAQGVAQRLTQGVTQGVTFNSTFIQNACSAGWVITLQPQPPVDNVRPGGAAEVNRTVTSLDTAAGPYLPQASVTIPAGYVCFFQNCTPWGTIELSCANMQTPGGIMTTFKSIRAPK